MPPTTAISSTLLLANLCACAATTPLAQAPVYTRLEAAATPVLHVAQDVTSLKLSCTNEERDNGLDDDCDGHIDEPVARSGALEVALTWSGDTPLRLVSEPPLSVHEERATCPPQQACVLRWAADQLPKGGGEFVLRVALQEDATDSAPIMASLSVAVEGHNLGTHNRLVKAGDPQDFGRLKLP